MNKINMTEIPREQGSSPRGRYRRISQDISRALRLTNGLAKSGLRQPFEVELVRLPPGAINWPYHSHSAQWELYMVVAGRGMVRTPSGLTPIREGDCLLHPPGEAHQFTNTGATDLIYYIIADNPASDVCHYPDTGKFALPGLAEPVHVRPANHYDGEE